MRILLIDNYDSFTFNLLHLIRKVCDASDTVEVIPNDQIDVCRAATYDSIFISPGPGVPEEAGNILQIIKKLSPSKPILGICLGHQAIAQAFGATLCCMKHPLHGIQTNIRITDHTCIFRNLGDELPAAGHYHSWLVDNRSFPDVLQITAVDEDGSIMALSHKYYPVHGVQFHPESYMTREGDTIVRNFLNILTDESR